MQKSNPLFFQDSALSKVEFPPIYIYEYKSEPAHYEDEYNVTAYIDHLKVEEERKRMLEVVDRIQFSYKEFLNKSRQRPNALFICQRDYTLLLKSLGRESFNELMQVRKFMGMQVAIILGDESHVALIMKN